MKINQKSVSNCKYEDISLCTRSFFRSVELTTQVDFPHIQFLTANLK